MNDVLHVAIGLACVVALLGIVCLRRVSWAALSLGRPRVDHAFRAPQAAAHHAAARRGRREAVVSLICPECGIPLVPFGGEDVCLRYCDQCDGHDCTCNDSDEDADEDRENEL